MLTISNFSKSYGYAPVLTIGEQVFQSGCYLIQGSNGAGKTTLFRSIAGLLRFQGDIRLNGTISLHHEPVKYRKHVNYCEAEPTFPPFLTANDLSAFVASAKNATKQQRDDLVRLFNMDSFLYQPVRSYSSGMLKKTSLLLGFLGHPQVILLDEPFTTIDADSLEALQRLISHLQNSCTFLISTHLPVEQIPIDFKQHFTITNHMLTLAG